MTVQSKPHSVVEALFGTFSDWLKHRRELNELRQLNTAEFDRIASELRVSPTDLNELVRQGPHAADELPKMLKVLGIDEEALARPWCCGTWSASAPCARTRANATAISPPAPPPNIIRGIASTRPRSRFSARR
jgi:hypothetical protein